MSHADPLQLLSEPARAARSSVIHEDLRSTARLSFATQDPGGFQLAAERLAAAIAV